MSTPATARVHLIVGGYPPGSPAAHDMDYARLRLLQLVQEGPPVHASVAGDFSDVSKWLEGCGLLITYVAGPYASDEQSRWIAEWLEAGGRWLALHGSSGGKAAAVGENRWTRKMVKSSHHAVLGSFFLNHPPLRRFRVDVRDTNHVLTAGLPESFEVTDELYLIELQDPASCRVLLTTDLPKDPSPPGFGFAYDEDTSLLPDGRTRVLGYTRDVGVGGVAYIALGHCHSPTSNSQPFVDTSVDPDGKTPLEFRGPWEAEPFERLLRNGIRWGLDRPS